MTWAELPVRLRLYISFLSILGGLIFVWALRDLILNSHNPFWIVLTVLVLLTLPLTLLLESVSAAVGIGDAYLMAIGMMYGVSPCVVATFLQIFIISIFGQRQKRYTYKIVFNTASTVSVAWLYSTIYHLMNRGSSHLQDIVVPAAVLVATYFFSNSLLTSISIAWSRNESITKFWAKACMPLAVDYSLSALFATILVALNGVNQYIPSLSGINTYIPLGVAPLTFALWAWNRYHKARIIQAQKHLNEQEQLYLQTVETLALAVDAKDQTTYGHIRRVKAYSIGLAKLCGITDPNELKAIQTGSLLHDIGKLAIDDYILNKPGRLSEKEFERIKTHATAGDEILQQVSFPYPVAKYVRSHHERWDGRGYPDGLKGEEIPLGARILAIADAFDAIRFSRPYKLSVSTDEAIEILRAQSGTYYDPELVQLFVKHIADLEQTAIKESQDAPKLSFRKYSESKDVSAASMHACQKWIPDIPVELIQIAEICNSLPGHMQLGDVLSVICNRLERLIPYSALVLFLDNGDNTISSAYATGDCAELPKRHTMELGKGISGWVTAYRRPMVNAGPALDFPNSAESIRSLMDSLVVPIIYRDNSLGALSFYSQKQECYGQRELNIAQTLASLLAPSIFELRRTGPFDSDSIDTITGLHRLSFLTAIAPQLISSAGESHTPISLIYLEVKNLNKIIRIFGSNYGNSLLKLVSECIKPELRETDILVRYGHQAFIAFLPGVRENQSVRCIDRLKKQVSREALKPGQGFTLDFRAGVACYPKDGSTVLALIQAAHENLQSTSLGSADSMDNVIEFTRP